MIISKTIIISRPDTQQVIVTMCDKELIGTGTEDFKISEKFYGIEVKTEEQIINDTSVFQ